MSRIVALVAAFLVASPALAANQQVDDTYRKGHKSPFYGRDDGLFYDKNTKIPVLIGNGDGYQAIGPTYSETFGYGDGLGLLCEGVPVLPLFTAAAGTNATCDATCAPALCASAYEASLDAAADILACSDNTADACHCVNVSADRVLLGCGANWETPAAGITTITFASGVKLGHVSLLQQDIGPDMDADGLDIAGDQTDNDGVELFAGMLGMAGKPMYPGVDPGFKFCTEINVEDLSGTDTLWIGFRDATPPDVAHTATLIDTYNSYFAIGLDNTSGDWHIIEEDDGDTHSITDVTLDALVESTATKVCVLVSDAGVATATVSGASASDAPTYTFDSGEPVIPFVHFVHASDVADEVLLTLWEVSYQ